MKKSAFIVTILLALSSVIPQPTAAQFAANTGGKPLSDDPLVSWNDGPAKQSILSFVKRVTTPGTPDFVPLPNRIATFDNDGTLWCEQPFYFQGLFVLDRIRELAPQHPEWKTTQPFEAALEGDMKTLAAGGMASLGQLVIATHAGMTTTQFASIVTSWTATARHPRFHVAYTDLSYLPMLEVIGYLRANGFKTYIASGGGVDFMRTFSERVYGIPPEQVIGSSIVTKYELQDGKGVLMRQPALDFDDNGPGKPEAINKFVGVRPILAFGNSDGDFQMLDWVTTGPGPRLGLLIHHDDAIREYAYDRNSPVGKLDLALDAAPAHGWIVVSMKNDWGSIFTFDSPATAETRTAQPGAALAK